MPNGGSDNCSNCTHYARDERRCALRQVAIEYDHWTTCDNNTLRFRKTVIEGPIMAIVCEVKNRLGSYTRIPYFDGIRVDTVQPTPGGDTIVVFREPSGTERRFASTAEYLAFYESSRGGR